MEWDTMEKREFYLVPEVAEILRMSVENLRGIIKAQRLKSYQEKPGSTVLIRHGDLMRFLDGMRVDVQPEKEKKP